MYLLVSLFIGILLGWWAERIISYLKYIADKLTTKQGSAVVNPNSPLKPTSSKRIIEPKTPELIQAEENAKVRKMNGLL